MKLRWTRMDVLVCVNKYSCKRFYFTYTSTCGNGQFLAMSLTGSENLNRYRTIAITQACFIDICLFSHKYFTCFSYFICPFGKIMYFWLFTFNMIIIFHSVRNYGCTLHPACTFPQPGARFSEVCTRCVHVF